MSVNYEDLISGTRYDKKSKSGEIKVLKYLGKAGSTHYYSIKFKVSGNTKKVSRCQIINESALDTEYAKKLTKKKNKEKKKEKKIERKQAKRFVMNFRGIPRLLSLDLSTYSSGYSVWIGGKLVKYGYIYQPKEVKFDTKRIKFMRDEVAKLIDEYNINVVSMEDIIYKTKLSLYSLSKLQGVICDYLYGRGIRYALIHVLEWKTYLDINKNSVFKGANSRITSKEKTVDAINAKFGLDLREEFKDSPKDLNEPCYYDSADAVGIGYITIETRIKVIE